MSDATDTAPTDLQGLRLELEDLERDRAQLERIKTEHAENLERLQNAKAPISERLEVRQAVLAAQDLLAVQIDEIVKVQAELAPLEAEYAKQERLRVARSSLDELIKIEAGFDALEQQVKEFAKTLEPEARALLERHRAAQEAFFGQVRAHGDGSSRNPLERFDELLGDLSEYGHDVYLVTARVRPPSTAIGSALSGFPIWLTGAGSQRPFMEVVTMATQAAFNGLQANTED